MDESILTSIKKLLGIPEDHEHFDVDIIMHINSVFMILTQLGIGPDDGFKITDKLTTWNEYLPDGANIESVKSYMYLKVRLLFDPPLSHLCIYLHIFYLHYHKMEYHLHIQHISHLKSYN